jgi:hypothetical protein
VRPPVLGDPSVHGGTSSRLAHARVEPEVADQLGGRSEAAEVADCGHNRERDGHVDAGDRHQPLHFLAPDRDARELSLDQLQLLSVEVELAHKRLDRPALVRREILLAEPGTALATEQVGGRTARHQVVIRIDCTWFFNRVR